MERVWRIRRWQVLGAWLSALLLPVVAADAADWPQWRGPNHDGVTTEHSGWDGRTWNITERWQVEVGAGMGASPIIVEGKVYVMGRFEDKDSLWCLDVATGLNGALGATKVSGVSGENSVTAR